MEGPGQVGGPATAPARLSWEAGLPRVTQTSQRNHFWNGDPLVS